MEDETTTRARPTMDALTTSPGIDSIGAALAAAQAEIEGATKDRLNPHFKSNYATLASVWEACRAALTKQGLAVTQVPSGEGKTVRLTTLLIHKTGQWIGGTSSMVAAQESPQAVGSCLTYLRRYALASLVGVAPEDDEDGNAASPALAAPEESSPMLDEIRSIAQSVDMSKGEVQAFAVKLGIKKPIDQMTDSEGKVLIAGLREEAKIRQRPAGVPR